MSLPMVDLRAQYLDIREEIDRAVAAVIDQTAFIKGPFVERFETAFARYLGIDHCIGVGNGTDALFIVLKGLGIGPGDEVVTAVNTFAATPEAISLTGATPVFCDVHPVTRTMDPKALPERLTEQTRAIIPVHLYGRMADMGPILDIARADGLAVVEDAAQAHGARLGDRAAGTFGDAATFSFYPGKNLGAYGDGGAIVTADQRLADWIRKFANHGRSSKFAHEFEGINSRLDGLQAAILEVKLRHLDRWCDLRRAHAEDYARLLGDLPGIICPQLTSDREHVFHLFVVEAERREALQEHLRSRGIATGIHYPQTMADLPAYGPAGDPESDFPVATALRKRILSLPLYPEMARKDRVRVSEAIRDFGDSSPVGTGDRPIRS